MSIRMQNFTQTRTLTRNRNRIAIESPHRRGVAHSPDRARWPWCTARTTPSSSRQESLATSRPSPRTPGSSSSRRPTPKDSFAAPTAPCASTPPRPRLMAVRSGGRGPTRSSDRSRSSGADRPWPWRSAPAAIFSSRSPSGLRFTDYPGSRPSPPSPPRPRAPTPLPGTTGGASSP
jgi:hypothetical protein